MAKQTLSPEELKQREIEMHAFLSRLPMAKDAPILFFDSFMNDLLAFENTLKRVKAFINFLSKLNPLQYLRWMQNAFAKYTAPTQTLSLDTVQTDYESSVEPISDIILPPVSKKPRKKKKSKITPA